MYCSAYYGYLFLILKAVTFTNGSPGNKESIIGSATSLRKGTIQPKDVEASFATLGVSPGGFLRRKDYMLDVADCFGLLYPPRRRVVARRRTGTNANSSTKNSVDRRKASNPTKSPKAKKLRSSKKTGNRQKSKKSNKDQTSTSTTPSPETITQKARQNQNNGSRRNQNRGSRRKPNSDSDDDEEDKENESTNSDSDNDNNRDTNSDNNSNIDSKTNGSRGSSNSGSSSSSSNNEGNTKTKDGSSKSRGSRKSQNNVTAQSGSSGSSKSGKNGIGSTKSGDVDGGSNGGNGGGSGNSGEGEADADGEEVSDGNEDDEEVKETDYASDSYKMIETMASGKKLKFFMPLHEVASTTPKPSPIKQNRKRVAYVNEPITTTLISSARLTKPGTVRPYDQVVHTKFVAIPVETKVTEQLYYELEQVEHVTLTTEQTISHNVPTPVSFEQAHQNTTQQIKRKWDV